jgi:hypothetical protein
MYMFVTTVEIIYNTDTCELFRLCMENLETLVVMRQIIC